MDFNQRTRRPDDGHHDRGGGDQHDLMANTRRSRGRHYDKCAFHCRPILLAQLAALPLAIALLCASAASQAATTSTATASSASTSATTLAEAADQLLVSTTTLASSTSTGAARGVKRASQQPQQAPASLGSLLDQQQASIQSMMARPFYSIKDGKTSARRIQQQTPATIGSAGQQQQQQQRDRQATKTRAKTAPTRQQAPGLTGNQQPRAPQDNSQSVENQLANSNDDNALAGEQQQVDVNNDQLALGVGQQQQLRLPTTQSADEQQQRQQVANMMLIDSFNQLVGADGGQLTSDFSTTPSAIVADEQRARDADGLAAGAPASGNEQQQQDGLATGSPMGAIKQSGAADSGASSQSQSPSSLSMSLDGMIVNSRPRATQGVGASSSLAPTQESASGESNDQTRATKGTKQRSSGSNNQKSIGTTVAGVANRQNAAPASSPESPSGQQAEGVERIGELPVRGDNPTGDSNSNNSEPPTSSGGNNAVAANKPANSRRVPFTGVPFSSPASKGQRTKPNASNQIGANLSSPFQVAKQQRQQQQRVQQTPRDGAVQSTGSGATDQSPRPTSVDQMAPSGFDEDSQQQQQQLQTQQQEGDGLAAMLAAQNNPNLPESSRPLATKLANGDMLMSLVSSTDGKERRLVMISRDTLASLQRFAAQQQMQMAQQQQQQPGQAAGASANSWWPASSQRSPRPDEVQTTLSPQQMTTTTTVLPPVNFGATSLGQLGGTRDSPSSAALDEVTTQAPRGDFTPTTVSTRFEQQLTTTTTTTVAPTTTLSTQRQSASTGQPDDTFREVSIAKQTGVVANKQPQGGAKSQQTSAVGRQSGSTATKSKQQQKNATTGSTKTVNKQNNRVKQNKQQQQQQQPESTTSGNKSSSLQQTQSSNANGSGLQQNGAAPVATTTSQNGTKPRTTSGANKGGRGKTTGAKQQRQKSNQSSAQNGSKAQASSNAPTTTTSTGGKRNKLVVSKTAPAPQTQQAGGTGGDASSKQTRPLSSGAGGVRQSPTAGQNAGQDAGVATKLSGRQQQVAAATTTVAPSTSTLTNGQQLTGSRLSTNSANQQQQQSSRQNSLAAQRPSMSSSFSPSGNQTTSGSFGGAGSDATQTTSTVAPMSRGELDRQLDELERANGGLGDGSDGGQDNSARGGVGGGADGDFADRERGAGGVFANELEGLRAAIPGEPIVDYPIYSRPPERTSFQCQAQSCPGGYYADLETQCQVFHVCQNDGRMDTFLCPNGTIFSQQHFVCVWWWQVECGQSTKFYNLNDGIYCNSMNLPGNEDNLLTANMDNSRRLPTTTSDNSQPASQGSTNQDVQRGSNSQMFQQAGAPQSSQDGGFATQQTDDTSFSTASTLATAGVGGSFSSSTGPNSDAAISNSLGASTESTATDRPLTSSTPSNGRQTSQKPKGNNLNEGELNQQQQQQLELLSRRAAAAA